MQVQRQNAIAAALLGNLTVELHLNGAQAGDVTDDQVVGWLTQLVNRGHRGARRAKSELE